MCIRLGAYASLWKIEKEKSWLERRVCMCGHWRVWLMILSTINFYHAAFSLDSTKRANVWLRLCSFQSHLFLTHSIHVKRHECSYLGNTGKRMCCHRESVSKKNRFNFTCAYIMCHTKRTMGIERTRVYIHVVQDVYKCWNAKFTPCVFLDILHKKSYIKIT